LRGSVFEENGHSQHGETKVYETIYIIEVSLIGSISEISQWWSWLMWHVWEPACRNTVGGVADKTEFQAAKLDW